MRKIIIIFIINFIFIIFFIKFDIDSFKSYIYPFLLTEFGMLSSTYFIICGIKFEKINKISFFKNNKNIDNINNLNNTLKDEFEKNILSIKKDNILWFENYDLYQYGEKSLEKITNTNEIPEVKRNLDRRYDDLINIKEKSREESDYFSVFKYKPINRIQSEEKHHNDIYIESFLKKSAECISICDNIIKSYEKSSKVMRKMMNEENITIFINDIKTTKNLLKIAIFYIEMFVNIRLNFYYIDMKKIQTKDLDLINSYAKFLYETNKEYLNVDIKLDERDNMASLLDDFYKNSHKIVLEKFLNEYLTELKSITKKLSNKIDCTYNNYINNVFVNEIDLFFKITFDFCNSVLSYTKSKYLKHEIKNEPSSSSRKRNSVDFRFRKKCIFSGISENEQINLLKEEFINKQ